MVPSTQADSFYVLKRGEILGPFSGDELKAQTEAGQFSNSDLVQKEGLPIWQPLGRVLGSATDDTFGAIAPDWRAIFTWAWIRLRFSLAEQSLYTGAVCLGIGTVALALSRWPFVYWFPWFGIAAAAAVVLLRRQRAEHALLLLAGVVCIPMFFMAFGLKAALHSKSMMPAETAAVAGAATPVDIPPASAVLVADSKIESSPHVEPLSVPAIPEIPAPQPAALSATPETKSSPVTPAPAPSETAANSELITHSESPGLVQRTIDLFTKLTGRSSEPPAGPSITSPTATTPLPSKPKATKPETLPVPSEVTEGDFIQSHTDAFVMIKGRDSSGSGFICRVGSTSWLFTNIHVVAGMQQPQFTRIDGTSVALGTADLAAGHDIMRLAVKQASAHPLEAISDFENNVRIGDEVMVLGNSGGGGVVTSLKGNILGLGPDRIEVSAEFIPGNSGSPIVHVKTGKVIGVATYLTKRYDEFSNGAPSGQQGPLVVRRFAYRIDSVRTWEPVNWNVFQQENEQIRQISLVTQDVFDFLGAIKARQVPQPQTDALRRASSQWLTTIRGQRVSAADRLRATEYFLRTLRSMVRSDVTTAEARLRYSYFRENLRNEREVRDRLYDAFDAQVRRMTSPSERFGG